MALPSHPTNDAGLRRWGRAQDRSVTDPCKRLRNLHEPTVCPQCGAVFRAGRWQWGERPAGAHEELCQACHRINDDYPAGVITLSGAFVARHKDEILQIVRQQEEIEKLEHPFNRIMKIDESEKEISVATTDIHLPRRVGRALERAFDGALAVDYDQDGYFVRLSWCRDR